MEIRNQQSAIMEISNDWSWESAGSSGDHKSFTNTGLEQPNYCASVAGEVAHIGDKASCVIPSAAPASHSSSQHHQPEGGSYAPAFVNNNDNNSNGDSDDNDNSNHDTDDENTNKNKNCYKDMSVWGQQDFRPVTAFLLQWYFWVTTTTNTRTLAKCSWCKEKRL